MDGRENDLLFGFFILQFLGMSGGGIPEWSFYIHGLTFLYK